jgi:hypothetical protein
MVSAGFGVLRTLAYGFFWYCYIKDQQRHARIVKPYVFLQLVSRKDELAFLTDDCH